MKIPPYMACLAVVLAIFGVSTSRAMSYSESSHSGWSHEDGGFAGRSFGEREGFSGVSRGWGQNGRSFYPQDRFATGWGSEGIGYPATESASRLNAHVITFNRSSDGRVTSFVDAAGTHDFGSTGAVGDGRYKFHEWRGGDGDHFRGWGRGHDRFWFIWPFYWGYPYYCAYPFYDDGFDYADYDTGDYAGPPVVTYNDNGPVPAVVPVTLPSEVDSGYGQLGTDWGQDLRREIVTWGQFVQYLRATVLTASAAARDEFRQGFIASYGLNAEAAFDEALRQASGPKIITMPPSPAPGAAS